MNDLEVLKTHHHTYRISGMRGSNISSGEIRSKRNAINNIHQACILFRIRKHLSNNFPIQNGLKEGDALSPQLYKFALEYAIRKVLETQV
jgi:hypothetical protein